MKLGQLPAFRDAVAKLRRKREEDAAWGMHARSERKRPVVLSKPCKEVRSEQGRTAQT